MSNPAHNSMSNMSLFRTILVGRGLDGALIPIHCPTCACRVDCMKTILPRPPLRRRDVKLGCHLCGSRSVSFPIAQCHWRGDPFGATVWSFWSNFTRSNEGVQGIPSEGGPLKLRCVLNWLHSLLRILGNLKCIDWELVLGKLLWNLSYGVRSWVPFVGLNVAGKKWTSKLNLWNLKLWDQQANCYRFSFVASCSAK